MSGLVDYRFKRILSGFRPSTPVVGKKEGSRSEISLEHDNRVI